MIQLTCTPIDHEQVLSQVRSKSAGAVVLFLGTTREMTGLRRTRSLVYECYEAMAVETLSELENRAMQRWSLQAVSIVHRLGMVEPGETSVAIAVSSAHRAPAFEAGQWLIDSIKQVVPIWKKENWEDGTSEWVHPGVEPGVCDGQ